MSSPVYHLEQVVKSYDGKQILKVHALQIEHGETFALIGPSGAGKSTLLRMLNFLEPPDQGRILFQGTPFDGNHPLPLEQRRKVTTLFQRPMLLSRSVLANVLYGLSIRGRGNCHELAMQALQRVGLDQLAHQSAHTLSGGEAQRVALARALVIQPEVLLLDEPTANLDPHNTALIEEQVRLLGETNGTTIVLVTHNIFQAKRLASRAGLLLEGSIVELAEAETFFERPQDERTAAFLRGEMIY
jgi:tungstate transport system ATP-binding protein